MNRASGFNSPFLLGFDQFERIVERLAKSAESYPPYNIEELGEGRLRITLAVAGFAREDLEVTLEASQLVIRGRQAEDGERAFLHRGIAARQFQRAFLLADGLEVRGARLDNGLLAIDLARPAASAAVRRIDIAAGSAPGEPRLRAAGED